MTYSGTGANRIPLGRLNPILLGRKRNDDGEPSLLSHHLRNRDSRDQTQSPGFGPFDDFGQHNTQYSGREPQQYERGQQGYDQRPPYSQGGQGHYDPRGQGPSQFQRGNQPFDQRNAQPFEQRNSQPYEQRAPAYDQGGNQHYKPHSGMQYDQQLPSAAMTQGYDQRTQPPPQPPPPAPSHSQMFDMGHRNFQPPDPLQTTPQRTMPVHPQPLMSANVGPMTARPVAMPPQPQNTNFSNPGQNGILGMPPTTNQNYGISTPAAPVVQATTLQDVPNPYTPELKSKKEPMESERDDSPARKKRKRSRWGTEEKKTTVPGMPATVPKNMTEEQMKQYLVHFKIEEIGMRLRTGDLGIPDNPEERSPSPEPIYNSEGKRLNTREFRVRKCLEEERHNLIQEAMKANPEYKPPADYKPPSTRIQEKVMIPQDANPAINFIGLLIGPRGNTLKKMEKETNCKIIIRGKGSVKEGKVGRAGMPLPGEDEPLHALVTGPTHEDVKKAVNVISKIIKEGIETPEGSNELRKMQLRELAALNGTLIEEDMVRCRNCGSNEHRHWECTEQKNVTHAVVCTKCGGHGHIATDCVVTGGENIVKVPTISERAKMDDEYMSLMAELGVDAPPGQPKPQQVTPVSSKEFVPIQPAMPPQPLQGQAPWNPNQSGQNTPWNLDKKDAHLATQAAPPPLMSQNTVPSSFGNKGSQWVPGAPATQGGPGQAGVGGGSQMQGTIPQPLMSMHGQAAPQQPSSSVPQGIPPLMTPHGAAPPHGGASSSMMPGMSASVPTGTPTPPSAPAPPGISAPPPPPPPSSSTVVSSSSAPVAQTHPPPWQTSGIPPWQNNPVPQQDPMAAFMPMMYPSVTPSIAMTPPNSAPLPPWMAAPPPPPPPPSS